MNLEALYRRLPTALQNAALSWEGRRVVRQRYGGDFDAISREVHARWTWTPEQVIAFRDRRLSNFVRHAVETTPHYRDLFARLRLKPDDIRTLTDLSQLPVLTKAEVQDNLDRFVSTAIDPKTIYHSHTSGTTGGGLKF